MPTLKEKERNKINVGSKRTERRAQLFSVDLVSGGPIFLPTLFLGLENATRKWRREWGRLQKKKKN